MVAKYEVDIVVALPNGTRIELNVDASTKLPVSIAELIWADQAAAKFGPGATARVVRTTPKD